MTEHLVCILTILILMINIQNSVANEEIPDPLTLEYVLTQSNHPNIQLSQTKLLISKNQQQQTHAENDLDIILESRLQSVETFDAEIKDDHGIQLNIEKPLYDFGKTHHQLQSDQYQLNAEQIKFNISLRMHKIKLMTLFLKVILADLKSNHLNEDMAIKYVRYDHATEQHALNRINDITLLSTQNQYQKSRYLKQIAENKQQYSRKLLALMMNKPEQLPTNLKIPDFRSIISRTVPDLKQIEQKTIHTNPTLNAINASIASMNAQIKSLASQQYPLITGHVELNEYSRKIISRERWKVGVKLKIPLYQGDKLNHKISHVRIKKMDLEAKRLKQEYDLKARIHELWLQLNSLKIQHEQLNITSEFRDLNFDRQQAHYELEIESTLGDAMALISEIVYLQHKNIFDIAITWAQIDVLSQNEE